jgi:hypothetical protein
MDADGHEKGALNAARPAATKTVPGERLAQSRRGAEKDQEETPCLVISAALRLCAKKSLRECVILTDCSAKTPRRSAARRNQDRAEGTSRAEAQRRRERPRRNALLSQGSSFPRLRCYGAASRNPGLNDSIPSGLPPRNVQTPAAGRGLPALPFAQGQTGCSCPRNAAGGRGHFAATLCATRGRRRLLFLFWARRAWRPARIFCRRRGPWPRGRVPAGRARPRIRG